MMVLGWPKTYAKEVDGQKGGGPTRNQKLSQTPPWGPHVFC